jgi:hypothetical protein
VDHDVDAQQQGDKDQERAEISLCYFVALYFGHTPTEICGNIPYLFSCVLTYNLTGALSIWAEKGRKRPTYLTK